MEFYSVKIGKMLKLKVAFTVYSGTGSGQVNMCHSPKCCARNTPNAMILQGINKVAIDKQTWYPCVVNMRGAMGLYGRVFSVIIHAISCLSKALSCIVHGWNAYSPVFICNHGRLTRLQLYLITPADALAADVARLLLYNKNTFSINLNALNIEWKSASYENLNIDIWHTYYVCNENLIFIYTSQN